MVDGHTDSVGTEEYNQALSDRRAKAVFDYLSSRGVDPARMKLGGLRRDRSRSPTNDDGRRSSAEPSRDADPHGFGHVIERSRAAACTRGPVAQAPGPRAFRAAESAGRPLLICRHWPPRPNRPSQPESRRRPCGASGTLALAALALAPLRRSSPTTTASRPTPRDRRPGTRGGRGRRLARRRGQGARHVPPPGRVADVLGPEARHDDPRGPAGRASWWTEILAPYAKRTGGSFYATGADLANPEAVGRRAQGARRASRRATAPSPTCTARSTS